jgi:D-aminopeptidase
MERTRARNLGIQLGTLPTGPYTAITDVAGVEVGQVTVFWGDGTLAPGRGPARTGVTVVWPHRADLLDNPVAAGCFALSGTGELTGWNQIQELGCLDTLIVLTNTQAVGLAYDAVWRSLGVRHAQVGNNGLVPIPVVSECDDSFLHDARGFHVTHEHVFQALDGVRGGPVDEGSVGAETGMHCFEFKGGVGTASRRLPESQSGWTVGTFTGDQLRASRAADRRRGASRRTLATPATFS